MESSFATRSLWQRDRLQFFGGVARIEVTLMAAATQLGMSASSFFCPNTIVSNHVEPTSTPTTSVVCQRDSSERKTEPGHVSRRFFAVASTAATAVGVFTQPEAAQAKRNKPLPPEEKKMPELEDKSLSKNEQRALANARRKEAMKATVEAAKAKAKSISSPE